MIIKIKYDVGDSVRYIERKKHKIWEPCPCCNNLGYIIGTDKQKYECPNCEGKKQVCKTSIELEEEKIGTISSIHVIYHSNSIDNKEPQIYYHIPQNSCEIKQSDIIERIFSEEEQLAFSD